MDGIQSRGIGAGALSRVVAQEGLHHSHVVASTVGLLVVSIVATTVENTAKTTVENTVENTAKTTALQQINGMFADPVPPTHPVHSEILIAVLSSSKPTMMAGQQLVANPNPAVSRTIRLPAPHKSPPRPRQVVVGQHLQVHSKVVVSQPLYLPP